jgi:phosphoethanolamine N-methyltransferase
MSRPDTEPEYDENFFVRLEMMWGEGFLSPGGAEEVRTIASTTEIAGKRVLDIGSGAGGAALLLAREFGASRVVGIDVVPALVERARELASGIDRVRFERVEPGPFPFEPSSFDVVFTKDALLHFPDKNQAFAEISRVLVAGGVFIGSDWLAGENIARCPAWARFIELRRPSFAMVGAEAMIAAMRRAGFEDIRTVDRNAWFADAAERDVATVEGPLRAALLGVLGEAGYREWLDVRNAVAGAARSGALRPTHLFAQRPQK